MNYRIFFLMHGLFSFVLRGYAQITGKESLFDDGSESH
jgi:hypothetical protein